MLIRRADEMTPQPMKMDGVKDVSMRLMVGRDDGAPTFAMRQFTVEPGGHTPRHEHNYEHEIYVLSGSGRAEYDGDFHPIKAGDVLLIQPNITHQFTNDGGAPLEFLCFVPIEFDCGGECRPTPGS